MPKRSPLKPCKSKPEESAKVEEKKPSSTPKKLGSEIDEIFAERKRKKVENEKTEKKKENEAAKQEDKIKKLKKKRRREEQRESGLGDSPSRSRRKTNDGLTIYSEEELGIGKADAGARQSLSTFPRFGR